MSRIFMAGCLPHMKNRQTCLRLPSQPEFGLFMRLLDEITGLKYNSLILRGLDQNSLSREQTAQIADFCGRNFIRSNLGGDEPEADFELDAASVVNFELRTRFDLPEKIASAKISYDGDYTVNALAESGFIFRLCAGAVALNQPDFGNDYWDRTLESAMGYAYGLAARLSGAAVPKVRDRFPVILSGRSFSGGAFVLSDTIDGCDALEIRHALEGEPSGGETAGQYILGYGDGSTRAVDLVAGRNIGPASAKWSHAYNPLTDQFDTDRTLQTACCYTRPEPYADAASRKITFYRLVLPGGGKRITGLSVELRQGVRLLVKSAEALYTD